MSQEWQSVCLTLRENIQELQSGYNLKGMNIDSYTYFKQK